MAGGRPGARRDGGRVEGRVGRESIQMRGRPPLVPVARDMIAAQRVDDDENDVGESAGRHHDAFAVSSPCPEASFMRRSASGPTLNSRSTTSISVTNPL